VYDWTPIGIGRVEGGRRSAIFGAQQRRALARARDGQPQYRAADD
jgi:hypothetical protein